MARVPRESMHQPILRERELDGLLLPGHGKPVFIDGQRAALSAHLKTEGIPHAIYYPKALHQLPVFADGPAQARWDDLTETIRASDEVISLPMHTELDGGQQSLIAEVIRRFFA